MSNPETSCTHTADKFIQLLAGTRNPQVKATFGFNAMTLPGVGSMSTLDIGARDMQEKNVGHTLCEIFRRRGFPNH